MRAVDNADDERRKRVTARALMNDSTHGGLVEVLKIAAKPNRIFLSPAIPLKAVPSGKRPEASMSWPLSWSRQRPTASKFSIAKPIGSIRG